MIQLLTDAEGERIALVKTECRIGLKLNTKIDGKHTNVCMFKTTILFFFLKASFLLILVITIAGYFSISVTIL